MTSVGIIVQARMGSTRLPGKVLRTIGSIPLLGHVIGRISLLSQPLPVVVATSTDPLDDAIVNWCSSQNVVTFRGSHYDVLDRYMHCARTFDMQHIVRLTADNPFTDIDELERLVELHLSCKFDYTHSFGMMPLGVGAEIISFSALQDSHSNGHEPNHREHVNEFIQENPSSFDIGILNIPYCKRSPKLRMTVDTEEDLKRAEYLVLKAQSNWISTQEAIALCSFSA